MSDNNKTTGETTEPAFNLDGRFFRPLVIGPEGPVAGETLFYYRQQDDLVWGTYGGGAIRHGTLVARMAGNGMLDMRYQHLEDSGALKTGRAQSVPERLPDGRIRLSEYWQWTCGNLEQGRSVIEEVPAPGEHKLLL
ncbi:MAG: n-acetylglutamate synthase [Deltaproteobacteria bacterium]|nr:n-acetylglutamate synthase [Deltaproteobacteria bacterium]